MFYAVSRWLDISVQQRRSGFSQDTMLLSFHLPGQMWCQLIAVRRQLNYRALSHNAASLTPIRRFTMTIISVAQRPVISERATSEILIGS